MTDLLLLPTPRRIERLGGEIATAGLTVSEAIAPATVREAGDEAYHLVADGDGVRISARTAAGLRWGRATWEQLRQHARIPCLTIDDAPLFAHRGAMLDISRDRVPTMATLCRFVDQLASWKMNHLQLYVEHTIAYPGHEAVWRAASPLSLDEISALDAYCTARGIALTANQNCLGHFERWLRVPGYSELAETATGQVINGDWYVEPNTLCPTDPRALTLVGELLGHLLPRCSGTYANIGCDEPWDLGKGRSREACERLGKGAVFNAHLAAVAEQARALGKRPQFWCDPHPNEGDGLPRDLIALVWGYEDQNEFADRVGAHVAAGREAWVAPGTSCWSAVTGRTWNRRGNLDRAAAERRANGFLCTAWGDNGHRQQWPITLFGFADAAQAAWHGGGAYDDRALGAHAFASPELGVWLARLGDSDAEICRGERPDFHGATHKRQAWNCTAISRELSTPTFEPAGLGDQAAWAEVDARLAALEASVPAGIDPLLADECRHTVAVARWTAQRALMRRASISIEQRRELATRMAGLIAEHRRLWLARCRYGGLEDSCQHYRRHTSP